MKKIQKASLFTGAVLMCLFLFSLILPAKAEGGVPEGIPSGIISQPTSPLVTNAKLISQDGNKIKASFDIFGTKEAWSGIRYSISTVFIADQGPNIMDTKFYDETVDLSPNENINKEVTYEAPGFLKGKYQIWVSARNSKGFDFGSVMLDKDVELNGTGEFLEPTVDNLYLKVKDDSSDKKYFLMQGVDIKSSEALIFHTKLVNHFNKDINFTPQFKTYYRSIFGKLLSTQKSSDNFNLKSGESKEFDFTVIKPDVPQAYDAEITFVDNQGKVISSPIYIHYVIQGQSATIRSVASDKDYYAEGETAKLSVEWSASADMFPDSRGLNGQSENNADKKYILEVEIKNSGNKACSSMFTKELTQQDQPNINVESQISGNCFDPAITARIKDGQGKVLDETVTNIKSKGDFSDKIVKRGWIKPIIIILIIIVALGIIFIKIINKRKNNSPALTLILLVLAGILFFAGDSLNASAATPTFPTFKVSKATGLKPGETITITWSVKNAVSCEASGDWSGSKLATAGTHTETKAIDKSSSFILTCKGSGGETATSPTITSKLALADISAFTVTPAQVPLGGSVTLKWSTSNAVSCEASGDWSGSKATGSNKTEIIVDINKASSFKLTCKNGDGTPTATEEVTTVMKASITKFRADDASDGNIKISWASDNATSCKATGCNAANCTTSGNWTSSNRGLSGEVTVVPVEAVKKYSLQCFGSGGNSDIKTISVGKPYFATFSVSPKTNVPLGGSVIIAWNVTGATKCEASGDWSGSKLVNAMTNETISNINKQVTSYTLKCSSGDITNEKTITATLANPTISAFTALPTAVNDGMKSNLTWNANNASSCSASGGDSSWPGIKESSDSQEVGPITKTTKYTLTCSGPSGTTPAKKDVSVSYNTKAKPVIAKFSAYPSYVTKGSSAKITWLATNATRCSATGDWSGNRDIKSSDEGESTGAVNSAKTYKLQCFNDTEKDGKGNPLSSAVGTVTVNVGQFELLNPVDGKVFSGDDLLKANPMYNIGFSWKPLGGFSAGIGGDGSVSTYQLVIKNSSGKVVYDSASNFNPYNPSVIGTSVNLNTSTSLSGGGKYTWQVNALKYTNQTTKTPVESCDNNYDSNCTYECDMFGSNCQYYYKSSNYVLTGNVASDIHSFSKPAFSGGECNSYSSCNFSWACYWNAYGVQNWLNKSGYGTPPVFNVGEKIVIYSQQSFSLCDNVGATYGVTNYTIQKYDNVGQKWVSLTPTTNLLNRWWWGGNSGWLSANSTFQLVTAAGLHRVYFDNHYYGPGCNRGADASAMIYFMVNDPNPTKLNVTIDPNGEDGKITSTEIIGGVTQHYINCNKPAGGSDVCSKTYPANTKISLSADPGSKAVFSSADTADCNGKKSSCSVQMNATGEKNVTVKFGDCGTSTYSCSLLPCSECGGTTNYSCSKTNSCGTTSAPNSECRSNGLSSCVDDAVDCPSCPDSSDNNWKEVTP